MNYFWKKAQEIIANRKPIIEPPDLLPPFPNVVPKKKFIDENDYEYKNVNGHVEAFLNGKWQFYADTEQEAREMIRNELKESKGETK